jgi:hypothetical protein
MRTTTFLLSMVLLASGCGSGPDLGAPATVSGKISRKGKPASNVTVGLFAISKGLPAEARYIAGKTDDKGEYKIEGVYPAEYMVTLAEDAPIPQPGANGQVAAIVGTPALAKYQTNSPLRTTVKGTEVAYSYDIPE